VFDEINDSLKRFWEVDTLGIQQSKPEMMAKDEKIAFDKVCHSLLHDGERCQIAVPWKSDSPVLRIITKWLAVASETQRNAYYDSLQWETNTSKSSPHTLKRVTSGKLTSLRDNCMMSGTTLIFQSLVVKD